MQYCKARLDRSYSSAEHGDQVRSRGLILTTARATYRLDVRLVPKKRPCTMSGDEANRWTPEAYHHLDVPTHSSRLHVVRGGSGPPLVLLAGWPQTWLAWRHVLVPLSHHFEVLAIELRGQGDSEIVDSGYDTAVASDDIVKVLTSLNIERAFVIGHDVGAWVAFTLIRDHMDRVLGGGLLDAAIPGLVGPNFFAPANAQKVWQFYFHAQPELAATLVEGKEAIYLGWYFAHKCFTPNAIPPEIATSYVASYSRPRAMWAGFRWYADLAETIKATTLGGNARLELPLFALGGEHATGDLLLKSLAPFGDDLQGEILAGCGHYIPEERPDAVVAWACKRFLKG